MQTCRHKDMNGYESRLKDTCMGVFPMLRKLAMNFSVVKHLWGDIISY